MGEPSAAIRRRCSICCSICCRCGRLLPRAAFRRRRNLLHAIDRMTPALRLFRHGDGTLGSVQWHGRHLAGRDRHRCSPIEDSRGQPVFNARYSGYQRLEARDALVIIDVGRPPPPLSSRDAHAGCLSFEFSLGARPDRRQLRQSRSATAGPARERAAHRRAFDADPRGRLLLPVQRPGPRAALVRRRNPVRARACAGSPRG